jgi:hypothetical protein
MRTPISREHLLHKVGRRTTADCMSRLEEVSQDYRPKSDFQGMATVAIQQKANKSEIQGGSAFQNNSFNNNKTDALSFGYELSSNNRGGNGVSGGNKRCTRENIKSNPSYLLLADRVNTADDDFEASDYLDMELNKAELQVQNKVLEEGSEEVPRPSAQTAIIGVGCRKTGGQVSAVDVSGIEGSFRGASDIRPTKRAAETLSNTESPSRQERTVPNLLGKTTMGVHRQSSPDELAFAKTTRVATRGVAQQSANSARPVPEARKQQVPHENYYEEEEIADIFQTKNKSSICAAEDYLTLPTPHLYPAHPAEGSYGMKGHHRSISPGLSEIMLSQATRASRHPRPAQPLLRNMHQRGRLANYSQHTDLDACMPVRGDEEEWSGGADPEEEVDYDEGEICTERYDRTESLPGAGLLNIQSIKLSLNKRGKLGMELRGPGCVDGMREYRQGDRLYLELPTNAVKPRLNSKSEIAAKGLRSTRATPSKYSGYGSQHNCSLRSGISTQTSAKKHSRVRTGLPGHSSSSIQDNSLTRDDVLGILRLHKALAQNIKVLEGRVPAHALY